MEGGDFGSFGSSGNLCFRYEVCGENDTPIPVLYDCLIDEQGYFYTPEE